MRWPKKEGDLYIGEDGAVFIRGAEDYSKHYPHRALGFPLHETPMTLVQTEEKS